jgi:hypothetical protein
VVGSAGRGRTGNASARKGVFLNTVRFGAAVSERPVSAWRVCIQRPAGRHAARAELTARSSTVCNLESGDLSSADARRGPWAGNSQ